MAMETVPPTEGEEDALCESRGDGVDARVEVTLPVGAAVEGEARALLVASSSEPVGLDVAVFPGAVTVGGAEAVAPNMDALMPGEGVGGEVGVLAVDALPAPRAGVGEAQGEAVEVLETHDEAEGRPGEGENCAVALTRVEAVVLWLGEEDMEGVFSPVGEGDRVEVELRLPPAMVPVGDAVVLTNRVAVARGGVGVAVGDTLLRSELVARPETESCAEGDEEVHGDAVSTALAEVERVEVREVLTEGLVDTRGVKDRVAGAVALLKLLCETFALALEDADFVERPLLAEGDPVDLREADGDRDTRGLEETEAEAVGVSAPPVAVDRGLREALGDALEEMHTVPVAVVVPQFESVALSEGLALTLGAVLADRVGRPGEKLLRAEAVGEVQALGVRKLGNEGLPLVLSVGVDAELGLGEGLCVGKSAVEVPLGEAVGTGDELPVELLQA